MLVYLHNKFIFKILCFVGLVFRNVARTGVGQMTEILVIDIVDNIVLTVQKFRLFYYSTSLMLNWNIVTGLDDYASDRAKYCAESFLL